jgi:hypothetical protein
MSTNVGSNEEDQHVKRNNPTKIFEFISRRLQNKHNIHPPITQIQTHQVGPYQVNDQIFLLFNSLCQEKRGKKREKERRWQIDPTNNTQIARTFNPYISIFSCPMLWTQFITSGAISLS